MSSGIDTCRRIRDERRLHSCNGANAFKSRYVSELFCSLRIACDMVGGNMRPTKIAPSGRNILTKPAFFSIDTPQCLLRFDTCPFVEGDSAIPHSGANDNCHTVAMITCTGGVSASRS